MKRIATGLDREGISGALESTWLRLVLRLGSLWGGFCRLGSPCGEHRSWNVVNRIGTVIRSEGHNQITYNRPVEIRIAEPLWMSDKERVERRLGIKA